MKILLTTKKHWLIALATTAYCILNIATASASAQNCTVSEASGIGDGSLPALASGTCPMIDFDPSLTTVTVPLPVTIKEGVTIDGGRHVTVTADFDPNWAVLKLSNNRSQLLNIGVSHSKGLALQIGGSGNLVQNCSFNGNAVGIEVLGGRFNLITQNSFSNNDKNAILLTNGNENLASPSGLQAQMAMADRWTLQGTVPDGATTVEAYYADTGTPGVPQGITYLPVTADFDNTTFRISFDIAEYNPASTYTFLAIDSHNNTSAFSANFTPVTDDDISLIFSRIATRMVYGSRRRRLVRRL